MKNILLLCLFLGAALLLQAQHPVMPLTAISPDQKTLIQLDLSSQLGIRIIHNNKLMARISSAGLVLKEEPAAYLNPRLRVDTYTPFSRVLHPAVPEKRSNIPDQYQEAEIWFKGGYGIKLRAYNDGVAYRFITRFEEPVTVVREVMDLVMNPADSVYFGEETDFISHSEKQYPCTAVSAINENRMCILPAVFRKADHSLIAISEADLSDYPGLYLRGKAGMPAAFEAVNPAVAADLKISEDKRSMIPGRRLNYIAHTAGTREYPWRVFGIADRDADLLSNDLVYRLGAPCRLTETSWIRPGKVAWDWWNNWNISGVPFRAGINTETYKYYIDFASRYGLEYVILDEGWSANDDLEKINPDINMDTLTAYAAAKKVRLILWVTGRALEEKFESSLARFEKWGIAGIKVDFLIRDDQEMVNFYEKVAEAAARRHMLVDFHGSFKPTGFSRTWPNALTREGVQGSENNKWSKLITPAHDCTIPFTRMFAGAMDYTPGAMTNAVKDIFAIRWSEPMSMGTRCHELAKYVVFESPLQMLCDNPGSYQKEPECMRFLSAVPVTWDETVPLDAAIGQYVLLARRHKDEWYVGALSDWSARDMEVDFRFLPEGTYRLESWSDGPNADRKGEDFAVSACEITPATRLKIHMAPGGGYTARITRK